MRGTGVRGIGTRFALFGNRESLDSTRRSDNHGYTNTRGYTATHGNMETRGHTDTRGYTNIRGQTENRGYSTSYGYAGTHDLNIRGGTENSDITDTTRLSDIHGTEFRGLGTRQLSQKPPEVPKKPDFLRSHAAHQEPSKRHSQDQDIIGFASLPDQVHRKTVKRGFDFTLMVVGDTGLGKSTLINSLFLTEMYKDRNLPSVDKKIEKTVAIETKTMEIEEKGVRLRLTIVDTPGYGDSLNCEENWKTIERYIDDQFNQFFQDESGVNRKNIQDHRVHCCLYFIPPFGHGLRQLDIEFMKRLQTKVNIVPVIAKADALTPAEIKKFKSKVLSDIDENKIKIYQFPDCDDEEDEEFKQQDRALKASIPFAVIGSNCVIEVAGNRVRGRQYPWGIVEVENGAHCDFVKLRTMLISTHMQDLKDVTQDVHYETFRARCISQMHVALKERSKLRRDSMTNLDQIGDTDRLLKQKDDEIRKMQDMLNKMKQRLKENGSSSFGSQIHNGQRDSIVNV